ncbi:hypothetical protein [Pedobacter sp. N23S346]|uniref:hypothetical protein n=1 Tax=Pedobacter sp. N23S346 TaxID=3402750 RepID=UPI003AD28F18
MSTDNKANGAQKEDQFQKPDQNIEWDHEDATYGHISNSPFKRKDVPDDDHIAKVKETEIDVNENLKNTNLSTGEDPANRNSTKEKGLGGKDL